MKYPRYAPLALGIWLIAIYAVSAIPVKYQLILYVITGACLILTYIYRTIVFYAEHQNQESNKEVQQQDTPTQV